MRRFSIKLLAALVICLFGLTSIAMHFIVQHQVHREVEALNGIISRLGPRFDTVHAAASTHPMAWIFGTLPAEDRDWLFLEIQTQFGEQEAQRVMSTLKFDQRSTTQSVR